MAEETPFIDVLSDAQRAIVTRYSRGDDRPSYYDATLVETEAGTGIAFGGNIQISLDLEAVIILMGAKSRKEMINFLTLAGQIAQDRNQEDFRLMTETVAIRGESYGQISQDVGSKILQFDAARARVMQFVENTSRTSRAAESSSQAAPDASAVTAVVLPDLGVMFASMQDAYSNLSIPDELVVHDRIADTGILYTVQNAAFDRAQEITSWITVFQAYTAT